MSILEESWVRALSIAVLIFCFLYFYSKRSFNYWKRRCVVQKSPVPFFGNFKSLFLMQKSLSTCLKELYEEFPNERIVGVYQSLRPVLLIRDPNLIKHILVQDFQSFVDREKECFQHDPLTQNIFFQTGKKWKKHRRVLNQVFTSDKMKSMFQILCECATDLKLFLKNAIDKTKLTDMQDICTKYTMHVICFVAFGIETNTFTNPNCDVLKVAEQFLQSDKFLLKFYSNIFFPKISRFIKIDLIERETAKSIINIFKNVIYSRKKNQNNHRNDFIDILLKVQEQCNADKEVDGFVMTDDLIFAQSFLFLLAGYETSSSAISFIMYELALNPIIQRRVQKEIDEVLVKYEGVLSYDALHELKYLEQVFNEGLRKYPPFGNVRRICTKAYRIPGTNLVLNPNDMVQISIHGLHHDPKYYPDPSKFNPDRFTENAKKLRPSCTFLPFSEGPRNCIGQRFAKLQGLVGLVAVFKNFNLSAYENSKTKTSLQFDNKNLVLKSKNGIWLIVEHRCKLD